jgi:hypothetical protein
VKGSREELRNRQKHTKLGYTFITCCPMYVEELSHLDPDSHREKKPNLNRTAEQRQNLMPYL